MARRLTRTQVRKLNRRKTAEYPPTPYPKLRPLDRPYKEAQRTVPTTLAEQDMMTELGLGPIAVVAMAIGLILVLIFILHIIPWGMGNGCWAQC